MPLPLRPMMPKNSPLAMSTDTSLTAWRTSNPPVRNPWIARCLSVWNCSWGSLKRLFTSRSRTAVSGTYRSSATWGALRANTHRPSRKIAGMIATAMITWDQLPASVSADGNGAVKICLPSESPRCTGL